MNMKSSHRIVGRLTADPAFKTSPAGKSYCTFVVVENSHADRRDPKNKSIFWSCAAFGDVAIDVGAYKKGQRLCISKAKIVQEVYDGRTTYKVYANEVMMPTRGAGENEGGYNPPPESEFNDEEVPF